MKWVELIAAHPKHGAVGKKFEIDEAVAKSLINDSFAKECEEPAYAPTPGAEALAKTIKDYVDTGLKAGFAELRDEQRTTNTAITKHFGSNVPATVKDADLEARFGFKSDGEYFDAVKNAAYGVMDDRLAKSKAQSKAIQGANSVIGSDGGWLAPATFAEGVYERAFKKSQFASLCDNRTINGASLTINALDEDNRATGSRRGGVRAYWLDEGDAHTKSKPKFRRLTLKPHKLGVLCYCTEEELEDSTGFDWNTKLSQYASEEIAWMTDEAILCGVGNFQPLGVLNAPATISVAKEGSQTAATVNYLNVKKMYFRMHPDSMQRAKWYMNQDVFSSLMDMAWPNASGSTPVFVNGAYYPNVAEAPYGTLFGRPIEVTEHNETLGTVGDIVFADFSQYVLGTKAGIKSAMSIHVEFLTEQLVWRFSYRVDGQPIQKAPLTPAKGTANTLSSFVSLATRS